MRGIEGRFWKKAERGQPDACWLWTGATDGRYGALVRSNGKGLIKAHRLSWELHHGPIPTGMVVCHRCDTPLCVNPAHLFLGTQSDNLKDASEKGRLPKSVGQGRLTRCKRGHEFTEENTIRSARGRECRTCKSARRRAFRERTGR